MKYEKILTIKKDYEEVYRYYVIKNTENEFGCDMYNVGVAKGDDKREIENFSPSLTEAKELCDYLYNENISINNLFSAAEEFITCLGI